MLIVLGGLPGVGKTTLARELALALHAVHIRIDSVEQAVRESGVTVVSLDDAGYRAGHAVAEDNLELGHIVIADSVNPLPVTRDAWLAVGQRAGVTVAEVEVECSDVDEHRRRVEQRLGSLPGLAGPTWQEVLSRDYAPWDREHILIDTAGRTTDQTVSLLRDALSASTVSR